MSTGNMGLRPSRGSQLTRPCWKPRPSLRNQHVQPEWKVGRQTDFAVALQTGLQEAFRPGEVSVPSLVPSCLVELAPEEEAEV